MVRLILLVFLSLMAVSIAEKGLRRNMRRLGDKKAGDEKKGGDKKVPGAGDKGGDKKGGDKKGGDKKKGKEAGGVDQLAAFGYDPDAWTPTNSTGGDRTTCQISQATLDASIAAVEGYSVGCRRSSDCGGEPCRYHFAATLCQSRCQCDHQPFMCDD